MKKNIIILWIISLIATISVAVYQRITGPTYPKNVKFQVNNNEYKVKFPRSAENNSDCKIVLPIKDDIKVYLMWKRYKTKDTFQLVEFKKVDGEMVAFLPKQPPAGKLQYNIQIVNKDKIQKISDEDIIIRFKGVVPNYVLIPHIIFMFVSLLFSFRAGLSHFFKDDNKNQFYVLLTLITLIIGGFLLGPIMQKYAFGEYWTGFPFGIDLTDNKTLLTFIIWLVVYYLGNKIKENSKKYALVGLIIMVMMYLIPHSTLGSELDYNKLDKQKIEKVTKQNEQ
ncbi:MAG TPA: hypothetical protein PLI27_00845 [Ignavibacteriales bacterium]|nr:hypothetical protein [Ignavibacteriales bacterium]HOL80233.1 hypothetical protein [Ignavibacteriales bacterium]HOM64514.1 hypothetical protein [Ignavibacteriales bacterium]HPD66611.1 hypothetical protein [Ignavibacteriales bacterium]HPP32422.1 hypothetical protein [Ignavibacteriales bacterium]